MKINSPFRCDYCKADKGPANHWWLRPINTTQFILRAWDDQGAQVEGIEHICSESCASKALSKWMERQKLEATVAPIYDCVADVLK